MHCSQSVGAETELRHLAAIPYQMVSPSSNAPIIGIYQDSLLGSYRFTRPNIKFSPRDAMNLLMMYPNVNTAELKDKKELTSFDVLSQILPPLTLKYKTKLFEDSEDFGTSNNVLEIRNGKYIRGQIEKSTLASTTKGIIHRVCNDFGNLQAADFIDNLQNVVTEFMKSSSFSVGISDLISNKKTQDAIIQAIAKQKHEVQTIIEKVHLGVFENNTANTNMAEFESNINKQLNKANEEAGKIGRKSLNKDNRFLMIVDSGSKGTLINISQMISCLGQTNVDGKRIPYGFDSRTLPHFNKFDDSPGARGFIENSYISGLTAPELFFHAMGGRIGLIDTACKSVTWETPIVFIENDVPKYMEIGKWIDERLEKNSKDVQHFTDRQMELLNINNVYIPTTDENGVVTWGEVTAMTRHDPGVQLYEIKTDGGRSVIVTESKSLLIWNEETKKLVETSTPDIKVGDYVPVTAELCQPPVILNSVDMTSYLPKTEYVYGSDFNTALHMMKAEMDGRKKIPEGWWDNNNGINFTLPYTKKSSLQRTLIRSSIEQIKDGYIYPYHANRKDTMVPDKFELNEENGIFIGLFLAEGNASKNNVYITNNNENIKSFTKYWFDKHSISNTERSRTNKIGGTTTTICGNSSILSEFLTKFVGHKAENKYVPTEAFLAPEPFIVGLLNGYYSGDGTISKNSIEVGSASRRLIEGISMLCSRLGIYGKMFTYQAKKNNIGTVNIKPSHRFTVRAQCAKLFSQKINLLEENKQRKMTEKKWASKNAINTYNNVFLDPIKEINIIGIEAHPKVYDLTIPSTLNFGLANGLQVRDTSSTGYIQRRLIKGLEDLRVEYDMTVRNNMGKIVQFSYGDDGFDSIRVENQMIPLVGMSIEDVYSHYDMVGINDQQDALLDVYSKGTQTRIRKQRSAAKAKCQTFITKMLENQGILVKNVFSFKNENSVKVPVAFQNLIANVQGQMSLNANSIVDITPLEAFQLIDEYYQKIQQLHYVKPTPLFETLYYFYMTPKDLLVNKRFHRAALTLLLETIVLKYKQAIVHPGEMVGVIAGQSLGEPTTQLTLNSVTFETAILVRNSRKEIQKVQIGQFTKDNIKTSKNIDYMADKDTTYAELSEYYEVPCANEEGETVWRRIEAVTQHPVVNEDGTNTMLKIKTKGNREITVTKAKSVLQLIDGKIQGVNGKDLKIGDYLPCSRKSLEYAEQFELNLREILPPTEYIYGSELEKARAVVNEHQWWKKHSGKTFILPYNRSDSAYLVLCEHSIQSHRKTNIYKDGCVYTKTNSICNYTIPENIPMDYEFGYLVGAYAAEGCMTKHQVSIANNDIDYLKPIINWCDKYNLTTKIYKNENKIQEGWTSQDVRIYSTVLCRILSNLCGNLSHNKYVSPKIVFSNKECILGFLDAYIGGDGTIGRRNISKNEQTDYKYSSISVTSVSQQLLLDVQIMIKNMGIVGEINMLKRIEENNRGTLPENIHQAYSLTITNKQCQKLAALLNIKVDEKKQKCVELLKEVFRLEYSKKDLVVPNLINGDLIMQPRDNCYPDMMFEQIVSIEEVSNTTNYAYDLTVEDTRNFDCYNAVCLRDTFHLSGVASKSNVTRGVPRIEEILRLTKNPKNPSLTVYLKSVDELEKDRAAQYAKMLEHTKLVDVVKSVQICFDPNDRNTTILDDELLMAQYYEFEEMMAECLETDLNETTQKSRWILRMEMDSEALLDKNITMDDVHFAVSNGHSNDISCIYSDYNAGNLVFRIRLNSSVFNKTKKQKGIPDTLDQSDEIYMLRNFQEALLNNIVLRGVEGIRNVLPRKLQNNVLKDEGKYVQKDVWILDTTGTNLMEVMALDFIDGYRTFSNDIKEIFDVLGIEAARQIIYNEFYDVMEFSDVYINYHHLSLLCDRMTSTKDMVSIFRSGILNDDIGPISKATFEVQTEVLLDASKFAEVDYARGVSANVMLGQPSLIGTNSFGIVLDIEKMREVDSRESDTRNKAKELEKAFGLQDPSDTCGKAKIQIENNLTSIKAEDIGKCDDDGYDAGF